LVPLQTIKKFSFTKLIIEKPHTTVKGVRWLQKEGLNGAWTQFAVNKNHHARSFKPRIYKHKWSNFILVHPNLLGYIQFSLEQTVQEVALFSK